MHHLICFLPSCLLLGCDPASTVSRRSPTPANSATPVDLPITSSSTAATRTSGTPADCFFYEPGDVTIVTDGTDFRLRLRGGIIGSEVFASKQEAGAYIYEMKKVTNPAAGKTYRPVP